MTPVDPGSAISSELRSSIRTCEDAAVVCSNGHIIKVGNSKRILSEFSDAARIDCCGWMVTPAFVDAHTHLVFDGDRSDEISLRLAGKSYLDINRAGGGIQKTVRLTSSAGEESLKSICKQRLENMRNAGTATVEVKSGYGLLPAQELKILRVIAHLSTLGTCDVVPTYLPLHTMPRNVSRKEFLRESIASLRVVREQGLAVFCDAFCEKGFFSPDECEKFLSAAGALGFKIKVHANEFGSTGGAMLAAKLMATSADHLDYVNLSELRALAKSGTIAVLLPGVSFFLGRPYPDPRKFINHAVPVALATDYNPGTSPIYSMPFIFSLAVLQMKMFPEEALVAATLNGAYALGMGRTRGSIEPGKKAHMIIWMCKTLDEIAYEPLGNRIHSIVFDGKVVT